MHRVGVVFWYIYAGFFSEILNNLLHVLIIGLLIKGMHKLFMGDFALNGLA